MDAVNENLSRGIESAKSAKSIEELLASFSATLLRQVFIQIGTLPHRTTVHKAVTLDRKWWRLNGFRSVQYVQSQVQIESAFLAEQQHRVGFEKQMELRTEHHASKSKLSFSVWCREHEAVIPAKAGIQRSASARHKTSVSKK
jgi:hypothetical protein